MKRTNRHRRAIRSGLAFLLWAATLATALIARLATPAWAAIYDFNANPGYWDVPRRTGIGRRAGFLGSRLRRFQRRGPSAWAIVRNSGGHGLAPGRAIRHRHELPGNRQRRSDGV